MFSRTLLIFLITILVGLVLFLGGYLLHSKDLGQTAAVGRLERFSGQNSPSSVSAQPRLHRLSTVKALGPAISEDGRRVLFFEEGTGKVLASDFEGKTGEIVSGKIIPHISSALWSSNGYEALLAQRFRGSLAYSHFNLQTGQLTALPTKLSAPAWSYHGKKIVYLYADPTEEEGSISTANPDGSLFSNVFATRIGQWQLFWPKDGLLSFINRNGETPSLFTLDPTNSTLTKIFGPVTSLQTLWSPDASRVLLSYSLGQQKKFGYLNLADHSENYFDFLTTAPQCAWSINSVLLYCGGKEKEEQTAGLYLIDTKTKRITGLFSPSSLETFRMDRPFLTPAEDFIIFINSYDQYLYSISLYPVK